MRQDLQFGVSLRPIDDVVRKRMFAQAAEEDGLDLIGIQDHPYVSNYLDPFVLAGDLLAATKKITVFPDVANLPLRPPALLAETAAALDLVSGGRFELALGAGGSWDAIARLGVPRRTPREANVALEEAIAVMRSLWAEGGVPVRFEGEFHSVSGVHPGPAPAHLIEIWTGLQGPKALARTGRIADGWAAPIAAYLPYEHWAEANRISDKAAEAAGRIRSRSAGSPRSSTPSPHARLCADHAGRSPRPGHSQAVGEPAGAPGHRAAVHRLRLLAGDAVIDQVTAFAPRSGARGPRAAARLHD